jgi:hypothetical protein
MEGATNLRQLRELQSLDLRSATFPDGSISWLLALTALTQVPNCCTSLSLPCKHAQTIGRVQCEWHSRQTQVHALEPVSAPGRPWLALPCALC